MDVTFFENQSYFPKSDIQGENSREYQIWDILQDTQAASFSPSPNSATVPAIVPVIETEYVTETVPVPTPKTEPMVSNPPQLDTNPELRVYRRRRPAEHGKETMQNQHS